MPVPEFDVTIPPPNPPASPRASSVEGPVIIVPELTSSDQSISTDSLWPWWPTVWDNLEARLEDLKDAILSARAFCVEQYREPAPVVSSRFVYDVSTTMAANPPRDCTWHFNPQLWRDHSDTLWEATQSPHWRALLASHISMWMPEEAQVLCLDGPIVS